MAEAIKPITQRAIDDLVDALAGIQEGETPPAPAVGDGVVYRSTLTPVTYNAAAGEPLKADRVYVIEGKHIPQPSPLGKQDLHIAVVVACVVVAKGKPKDGDPTTMDLMRIRASDIRMALDPERLRVGGNIINVIFDETEFDIDAKPPEVGVPLLLHVRHARNDPYSL